MAALHQAFCSRSAFIEWRMGVFRISAILNNRVAGKWKWHVPVHAAASSTILDSTVGFCSVRSLPARSSMRTDCRQAEVGPGKI